MHERILLAMSAQICRFCASFWHLSGDAMATQIGRIFAALVGIVNYDHQAVGERWHLVAQNRRTVTDRAYGSRSTGG